MNFEDKDRYFHVDLPAAIVLWEQRVSIELLEGPQEGDSRAGDIPQLHLERVVLPNEALRGAALYRRLTAGNLGSLLIYKHLPSGKMFSSRTYPKNALSPRDHSLYGTYLQMTAEQHLLKISSDLTGNVTQCLPLRIMKDIDAHARELEALLQKNAREVERDLVASQIERLGL